MTTIQGVPDLGPGLRLHLNENTGGCSPKVVEAVRAFDGRAPGHLPRLPRRHPRDRGLPRRRSRSHRAHQRPGRGHSAGLDRLPRPAARRRRWSNWARRSRHRRAHPRSSSRNRRSNRISAPRMRWARASCRCRPRHRLRVSGRRGASRDHAEHADRLRQQSEQPERAAGPEGRDSPCRARGRPRAGVRGRGVSRLSWARTSCGSGGATPTCWSAARSRRRSAWPACGSA